MKTKVNVLREDIYTDAYLTAERMIHDICWKFKKRFGGEIEDWIGEAHVLFMEVVNTHDPRLSQFTTWLWNRLHWRFLDVVRKRMKENEIKPNFLTLDQLCYRAGIRHEDTEKQDIDSLIALARQKSCLMKLIEETNEPIIELYYIIQYPPQELADEINTDELRPTWDAIWRYCIYSLHWSWDQTNTAIKELIEICKE